MDISTIKDKLSEAEYELLNTHIKTLTEQRDFAKNESISNRKTLKAEIDTLTEQLQSSTDKFSTLEKNHTTTILEAQLSKALGSHQFVDNELVSEYVKARSSFDNGKLVYKEGSKTLSIDEGIKLLAATKPHLLKAQGTSGSGFNPNSGFAGPKSFATMSVDERSALYKQSPELYRQAKTAG